jgi:hypothetical protein
MNKPQKYKAIVNGKQAFIEVPDKKNPEAKVKVPIGSEDNFVFEAQENEHPLVTARKIMREKKLKEKKFKGVIQIN